MWFVSSLEVMLRRDLVKDYRETRDTLTAIRGSVDAVATSAAYYQGRLECVCNFDEFDFDTANNRVLKAAALEVVGSFILPADLRRRAARLLARLQGVGDLRPRDVSAATERRTAYYGDALMLATNVLQGRGRDLQGGESLGWTFLLRAPEMVEEGIRSILQKGLYSKWKVAKRGIQIEKSNMTLTPDLVFESLAVGDVKYKVAEEWLRSDLYQAVTFAEGFDTKYGCIVSFATEQKEPFPAIKVGEIVLNHFQWLAEPAIAPSKAATLLVAEIDQWLGKILPNSATAWHPDLCFARELGLLQVRHPDNIHAPGAVKIRFRFCRKHRTFHADIRPAALHIHTGIAAAPSTTGELRAHRIGEATCATSPSPKKV